MSDFKQLHTQYVEWQERETDTSPAAFDEYRTHIAQIEEAVRLHDFLQEKHPGVLEAFLSEA